MYTKYFKFKIIQQNSKKIYTMQDFQKKFSLVYFVYVGLEKNPNSLFTKTEAGFVGLLNKNSITFQISIYVLKKQRPAILIGQKNNNSWTQRPKLQFAISSSLLPYFG